MRRKQNALVPLEIRTLKAIAELTKNGDNQAYGFQIAKQLDPKLKANPLTSFGTLYRALERLGERGLVVSTWESIEDLPDSGRPRRRYYHLTDAGKEVIRCSS